jgi:hypothetical protein
MMSVRSRMTWSRGLAMDYCRELEGSEAKIRLSFWMKARSLV